jgi:hypothetical protein
VKSVRAVEYALPAVVLLAGHALALAPRAWPVAATAMLVLVQGMSALAYYRDIWLLPQGGSTSWYFRRNRAPPAGTGSQGLQLRIGRRVRICCYARPVPALRRNLLEPGAALGHSSHAKYLPDFDSRTAVDPEPAQKPCGAPFDAHYILCANPRPRGADDRRSFTLVRGAWAARKSRADPRLPDWQGHSR